MVAKNLVERIVALPLEERLELLHRTAESIRSDPAVDALAEGHRRILDERLAEFERDPE